MARHFSVSSCKRAAAGATVQEPSFSISWPGCGVMVFWQLGVLKGLSGHVDASLVPMLGSSSGALVTAMAACGVRPEHAAAEVHRLLGCKSLRQRRLGLVGVLGGITRTWLDNCLPHDAGALLSRRSTVLVTRLPLLTTTHITSFASKQDVLDVLLASTHLPLVLDGNWYALCRQQPVIDGGFWWWWQRCEKPYRVAGGTASPPSRSISTTTGDAMAASAAAAAAEAGLPMDAAAAPSAPSSRAPAQTPSALATLTGPLAGLWPSTAAVLPPPPPPPPVSYYSPTSLLDFIAADVQRHMAHDVGRGGAGEGDIAGGACENNHRTALHAERFLTSRLGRVGADGAQGSGSGGGGSRIGPIDAAASTGLVGGDGFGRPSGRAAGPRSSSATVSQTVAVAATTTSTGTGLDFDRGRVRNLAFAAAAAAEGSLAPPSAQMLRPEFGGGGGGGVTTSPPVLLVQPADDDALTAGWRRYRSWRPDDLAAAWEMMRHGEAYGSGPLLRRLEELA